MSQLKTNYFALLLMVTALGFFVTGCNDSEDPNPKDEHGHGDHDHDHGHDHGHGHDHPPHGPNGGHIFDLDSKDYSVEWCKFKDNDVIKMHILGSDNKNTAIKVDSFTVTPLAGNDDLKFELTAENADDDGKASTFMLDNADLCTAIPLGVAIEIKSGDKTFKGEIDAHEPLDH